MALTEREGQLEQLVAQADDARAGRGSLVLVSGESGAGKTSVVEAFVERLPDSERVLFGVCDPLSTPRPLGPIHDLADQLMPATREALRGSDHPYEIFAAVFEEIKAHPSVLIIDDLHWADQGTVDLLRFVLRRIRRTRSLVIGLMRDDDLPVMHPMRALLGDIARSNAATSLALPPLTLPAVAELAAGRPVDPVRLHRVTNGNPFFVVEMLDHAGDDLPTTVRDAILARTVGLDVAAWDLLYLLACAPGSLPYQLLDGLGVATSALHTLDEAKLIRRTDRAVAFRHDLCRLAIASVIPAGAEVDVHRRMIDAYEAAQQADPAVLTHHALGAGDHARILRAASEAGAAAARAGAHTQALEFYRIALDHAGPLPVEGEAELLELLADECYLTDRLEEAIDACRRAMLLRRQLGMPAAISADHHSLAVYHWYNANRAASEHHAVQAVSVLEGNLEAERPTELALLGHAFATQAFLAVQASDLERATRLAARAREISGKAGDPALEVRVGLIDGYCDLLAGRADGRDAILSIVQSAPEHLDEIYSSGYSTLSYLDVEQRRLDQAAELLEVTIPLTVERDLPICRVWQLGSRGRLEMLVGDWDDAVADADAVLNSPSAPLARTWPSLIRALISLRRSGSGGNDLDEAWRLARRFDEPLRLLPAAAAIAEQAWLSGADDDRLDECRRLLTDTPVAGLEWARGELAMWLHRLDPTVGADGIALPYRLLLGGRFEAAAEEFHRLSMPYEAALALINSGDADQLRPALDVLDRLGANAVTAKIRRDLRAGGRTVASARRRWTTLTNPAGLTTRQIDVLRLIDDGLTNAELAERLYLSVKTVDHHVSAILAKLEVTGRRDASRRARELGILT